MDRISSTPPPASREPSSEPGLRHAAFREALAAAAERFARLRKKYPALRGYLVLAAGGKQAAAAGPALEMIREFPELVLDGPAKDEVRDRIKDLELLQKDRAAAKGKRRLTLEDLELVAIKALEQRLAALEYHGGVRLEIRFHELDYELIRELQADPLVDATRTPRTGASIRIVLGTLAKFAAETLPEQ